MAPETWQHCRGETCVIIALPYMAYGTTPLTGNLRLVPDCLLICRLQFGGGRTSVVELSFSSKSLVRLSVNRWRRMVQLEFWYRELRRLSRQVTNVSGRRCSGTRDRVSQCISCIFFRGKCRLQFATPRGSVNLAGGPQLCV